MTGRSANLPECFPLCRAQTRDSTYRSSRASASRGHEIRAQHFGEIGLRVRAAFEIKVHRQKCEIVRDVDEAEAVVKLDAIEDDVALRSDMDVIEVQIAVAIANPMLLNSFPKSLWFAA